MRWCCTHGFRLNSAAGDDRPQRPAKVHRTQPSRFRGWMLLPSGPAIVFAGAATTCRRLCDPGEFIKWCAHHLVLVEPAGGSPRFLVAAFYGHSSPLPAGARSFSDVANFQQRLASSANTHDGEPQPKRKVPRAPPLGTSSLLRFACPWRATRLCWPHACRQRATCDRACEHNAGSHFAKSSRRCVTAFSCDRIFNEQNSPGLVA